MFHFFLLYLHIQYPAHMILITNTYFRIVIHKCGLDHLRYPPKQRIKLYNDGVKQQNNYISTC